MTHASNLCEAGRRCGFGGRWFFPCNKVAVHAIHAIGMPAIRLCDVHFWEANKAGLVTEPDIGKAEFNRRVNEDKEQGLC